MSKLIVLLEVVKKKGRIQPAVEAIKGPTRANAEENRSRKGDGSSVVVAGSDEGAFRISA